MSQAPTESSNTQMLTSRQEIVDYARTLLDTPFCHLGRNPSHEGVDCIGLLRACAEKFNLTEADLGKYGRIPHRLLLIEELDKCFDCDAPGYVSLPAEEPHVLRPGDVMAFWIKSRKWPRHVGIYFEAEDGTPMIVHSYAPLQRVVEHHISDWWYERIGKVYRWRGLED